MLEYVRYEIDSAKELFNLIRDVPKFSQSDFSQKYKGTSTLEELTISLEDWKVKAKTVKVNGEFPVC